MVHDMVGTFVKKPLGTVSKYETEKLCFIVPAMMTAVYIFDQFLL